jgi:hypothetical protein
MVLALETIEQEIVLYNNYYYSPSKMPSKVKKGKGCNYEDRGKYI